MEEQSLSISFGNSLTEEVSGIAGEYVELGLDALTEDGLFKELPFVSSVVSVYRIGKSIRERHHVVKLISFLNEINKGIADEEKRQKYRDKFASNEKFRNQELEYILILIDRYISFDKPQMLAKLYLAYLDGTITWVEFTMYAEIVDRILPGDITILYEYSRDTIDTRTVEPVIDRIQRLVSVGLLTEKIKPVFLYDSNGNKKSVIDMEGYSLTQFGEKLVNILR